MMLLFNLLRSRKGDIPGWAYVVGLIIGLIGLVILIYIIVKSGQQTGKLLEFWHE